MNSNTFLSFTETIEGKFTTMLSVFRLSYLLTFYEVDVQIFGQYTIGIRKRIRVFFRLWIVISEIGLYISNVLCILQFVY